MKKLLSALLIIASNCSTTKAQTFEKTLSFPVSTFPYVVKEFSNFYILSTINFNEQTGAGHSKLFKLDFNGNLIDSLDFNDYHDFRIYDIIPLPNDEFICCGSYAQEETDSLTIIFEKYTADIESITLTKNKINTTTTRIQTGLACAINERKSTFVYAYDRFDNTYFKGYYLFNLDANCNVLTNKHINRQNEIQNVVDDLIKYKDDTLLLVGRFEMYKVDSNLTFSDSISKNVLYNYEPYYWLGFENHAIKLDDKFIFSGADQGQDSGDSMIMNLGLLNESFEYLKYKRIKSNYKKNNKAGLHSLSSFKNNIYFCGTNNFSWGFIYYTKYMSIRLLKLDNNLNEVWDNTYYENDEYTYFPILTLATSDGGNLMACTKYHNNQTDEILSVHLLKVDSLGNYTPLVVEENKLTANKVSVYPNPGTSELNISFSDGGQGAVFTLYSIAGHKILTQSLETEQTQIATGHLSNGLYVYELSQNGVVVDRGKWVKQ